MNGTDEVIESALRTALHDAADQIDVGPPTSTATADELVMRRRSKRRAPMLIAIAACLVAALVLGGSLLFAGNDSSSTRPAAGAPGCAGKVYVAGEGGVSVIDTATRTVSATIPTSGSSWSRVAVTPDGTHVYVTGGTVSVIDTTTDKVSAAIDVAAYEGRNYVAIAPDGKHAYVYSGDSNVWVIDTAAGVVSDTIPVAAVGLGPTIPVGLAVTPDGTQLYLARAVSPTEGTVSVIDTATGSVSASITVGQPSGLAMTRDGKYVYVADFGETVEVIDTATRAVSAPIFVGVAPREVAFTPDGTHAYVTDAFDKTVSVIDTASGRVSARVKLGGWAFAVAITSDGKYAYVAGASDKTVASAPSDFHGHGKLWVIDTATDTVSDVIDVAVPAEGGLAVCPS